MDKNKTITLAATEYVVPFVFDGAECEITDSEGRVVLEIAGPMDKIRFVLDALNKSAKELTHD